MGALLGVACGDLFDEGGHLPVGGVHDLVEGAGDRAPGGDGGRGKPLPVHIGVEVVLQVTALEGVDAADEGVQLPGGDGLAGGEGAVGLPHHHAGGQKRLQLPGGPSGHVVKRRAGAPACAVPLGGPQLAEGAIQHQQGLHAGEGVGLPRAALVAQEHGAGVQVLPVAFSGGEERFQGLAPRQGFVRRQGGRDRAQHQGQGEDHSPQAPPDGSSHKLLLSSPPEVLRRTERAWPGRSAASGPRQANCAAKPAALGLSTFYHVHQDTVNRQNVKDFFKIHYAPKAAPPPAGRTPC